VITRDVDASAVADLAASPVRVALAANGEDGVFLTPVRVTLEDPAAAASSPRIVTVPQAHPDLTDRNVVVIADDGPQWFRLRSLTVRGVAKAIGGGSYRIVPERTVAWDYGSLREVPTPPGPPGSATPPQVSLATEDAGFQPLRSANLEEALGNSRVMILASRSQRGTPFAVPLWFVFYRGRIYATTSASSWTARNVAASPWVAFLVGGESPDQANRLVVRGYAQAIRGMPPPAVTARIAWRYYLQPRFAVVELRHLRLWALRVRYYGQSQVAHIVITPQKMAECAIATGF
jgi:pyridoxamine 5'-phosphate oxidase-like protein